VNIGYARVSTQDQNLDFQKQALKQTGCKTIFEDQLSGSRGDRPGLARALETLRAGDTLVVWKLFKSLTDNIDTSTTSGRFFFHVMASLAQMERELTLERTHAGLAAAKQQGKVGGRKRQMTDSKIHSARRLLADGLAPREVAKNLGVSVPTLYRWVPAHATS